LLATIGLLLLIPATWAVLLLVGVDVPRSHRADSRDMAVAMLACWPISLALLASAVLFFSQVRRKRV